MKKHNFYAGPSILSEYTIKNTAAAVENFAGMGLSLLEISHRSKEFVAVNDEARALIKELLDIPAGYEVVFLGGGASMQFCMVPYNLLNKKASYLDTGTWSSKAIKEAKLFGEVEVVASSKDKNYTYIPKDYTIADDADYFHITTNNTIYGTETRKDPDVKQRLVADMSSDIFSRPIDVSKYDIIYAGAQKNLAPAGVTLAIVRVDALGHVERPIPTMLNYKTHVDKDSMFNTPPVLPIYAALQTLKWYKEQGGVAAMEKKDMDLQAYQLSSAVFEKLGISEGYIMKFHQTKHNDADYLKQLKILEYDILYGDKQIYNGDIPYVATDLKMGIEDITIDEVYNYKDYVCVAGKNFNDFSKVLINDKEVESELISSTMIKIPKKNVVSKDEVAVIQSGEDKIELGRTTYKVP